MTWIAFASVPTILVVMLAMGQLEARWLPRTLPLDGAGRPGAAGAGDARAEDAGAAGPRWEVGVAPADDRAEAKT